MTAERHYELLEYEDMTNRQNRDQLLMLYKEICINPQIAKDTILKLLDKSDIPVAMQMEQDAIKAREYIRLETESKNGN